MGKATIEALQADLNWRAYLNAMGAFRLEIN